LQKNGQGLGKMLDKKMKLQSALIAFMMLLPFNSDCAKEMMHKIKL
jgi:hypothetical protein